VRWWKLLPLIALFFIPQLHGIVLLGAFVFGIIFSIVILPDIE
jgi:hypothetical protein